MEQKIFYITLFSQTTLSFVVGLLAVIKWRQRASYIKCIGLLFFVGFLCNSSSHIFSITGHREWINLPMSYYDIIAISILSFMYYYALNKKYAIFFFSLSIFFVFISSINLFLFGPATINSAALFLGAIVIIAYCVFYFYRLMVDLPVVHVHRMPMFWINAGLLIYNAGTLFLFAFRSYLTDVLHNDLMLYWSFHNILNIVEHVMVLVGLYYDLKSTRSPSILAQN